MNLIDEAREHIHTADQLGTSKPMTGYHLQLAQTKATLALAEQQRIANMIAFGQATGTSFRAEIRKALGLS